MAWQKVAEHPLRGIHMAAVYMPYVCIDLPYTCRMHVVSPVITPPLVSVLALL